MTGNSGKMNTRNTVTTKPKQNKHFTLCPLPPLAVTVQLRREGGGSGRRCGAGEWQETGEGNGRNQGSDDGGRS